jgi:DNA polymerase III subunit delta
VLPTLKFFMPAPRRSSSTSTSSQGSAANIHVVVGTDEGKVKEEALKLVKKFTTPGNEDFGNDIIDGSAENAEHAGQICSNVCQALQTLPFFGGKVVWLKGATFLTDSQTGNAEASVQGFSNILDVLEQGIPPDVHFVLSATGIDKRRTSFKRITKLANMQVFDKPDTGRAGWEGAVIAAAQQRAKGMNLTFESGALELLVMLCGDDTRQLENEMDKIDLYLGDRRRAGLVTVRNLVSMSRAGVVFEIGNAIGIRDLNRALELLGTLLYQGQNAVGVLLAAIVPKVRNLLMVKELVTRHQINTFSYQNFCTSLEALPSHATGHLPKKKDGSGLNVYPLFLAVGESRNFTLEELHAGLRACLEANRKLVTTQLDERVVLERLLIGLLTQNQRPLKRR